MTQSTPTSSQPTMVADIRGCTRFDWISIGPIFLLWGIFGEAPLLSINQFEKGFPIKPAHPVTVPRNVASFLSWNFPFLNNFTLNSHPFISASALPKGMTRVWKTLKNDWLLHSVALSFSFNSPIFQIAHAPEECEHFPRCDQLRCAAWLITWHLINRPGLRIHQSPPQKSTKQLFLRKIAPIVCNQC